MKKLLVTAALSFSALTSIAADVTTFVVGYPAGGDTDVLARMIATKYSELTGKPVVVENKPGAAGAIATNYVKTSPTDGSVLLVTPSTHVTAPLVNKAAGYDPLDDVTPIVQISGQGLFLAISSDSGVKTLADLRLAYKEGRVTTFGTAGTGTPMHVVGEMFNQASGLSFTHVPFKGNTQVVAAVLGNHVPMTVITLLPVIPHVEAGKVNLVAIAAHKRSAYYPDVPTLTELGIKNVETGSWLGFVGPKGMPVPVVTQVNKVLNQVLASPEVSAKLKALAMDPQGGTPEHFAQTIKRDYLKYKAVVETIKME